jgi:integrase
MKPPLRTKSVGTKVSEAEFAMLEERARGSGMRLAEWVREALLAAPAESGPDAGEVALAEVLALRSLLLNLHFRAAKGDPVSRRSGLSGASPMARARYSSICTGATRPRAQDDGLKWRLAKAGIVNFRWHDLRHTFASRLIMAGVDIRTLQELMGHKTIQMTVRYAHLAPRHQLDAVQRLCDTDMAQNRPTDTKTDTDASGSVNVGTARPN